MSNRFDDVVMRDLCTLVTFCSGRVNLTFETVFWCDSKRVCICTDSWL